jgi:hypothetical protein
MRLLLGFAREGINLIVDRFHRSLHERLKEMLAGRTLRLVSGGAVKTENDQVSTAEKYAAQTAYIQAINDFIGLCAEVSSEMHGTKKEEDE